MGDELKAAIEKERERRSNSKTKPPKRKPRRRPLPEHLERVDNKIEVSVTMYEGDAFSPGKHQVTVTVIFRYL